MPSTVRYTVRYLALLVLGVNTLSIAGCGSGGTVPAASGTTALSGEYTAFGDSITYGYALASAAAQAYPYLVATDLHRNVHDYGISGDQACDIFPRQILANNVGYSAVANIVYSLMIGTNDVDIKGPGAYEAVFNTCQQAALAWLATQPQDKLLPGDAAFAVTGACANTANNDYSAGLACTGAGMVTVAELITTGNAIYIWYSMRDRPDPTNAAFTITLDGGTPQTVTTLPAVSISTQNATTASVGLLRLPVAAGKHRIALATTTGGVAFQAIATNRSTKPIPVAVGDLPCQLQGSPVAPLANQNIYIADIAANIALLQADGLDLRFVADRNYMLGTAGEMNDTLHPNALGQRHLAEAFKTVLP